MKLDFKYYLSIFWRRFPLFLVVTSIFTSIGLSYAIVLPPEYRSQAFILVESEQIPDELAASTVSTGADEQIEIIRRRLMTRDNLLDTANRLKLYDSSDPDQAQSASKIVNDLRSRTRIGRVGGRRSSATILNIAVRSNDPQEAAQIANEFVTMVMQENIQLRTEQAGGTLEFFQQEVERLNGELDSQSVRILEFQSANSDALPGSAEVRRERLKATTERRADLYRELVSVEEQIGEIEKVFAETGDLPEQERTPTPKQKALWEARRELENAMLRFSATNPKIRLIQVRVSQLEQEVQAERDAEQAAFEAQGGAAAVVKAQVAQLTARKEFLSSEIDRLDVIRADLEDSLARTPANAIALDKLQRDYKNLQKQYNDSVSRLARAQTGERIELLSKGQRMSVIEQATVPRGPYKPDRPMIAAAGAGAGVAASLGLIALLEFLNRSIRRPVELTNRLGITPLAVLPYIRTERERRMKRSIVLAIIAVLLVLIPAGLFYVHTNVIRLDTVIEPYVNKLGFSIAS